MTLNVHSVHLGSFLFFAAYLSHFNASLEFFGISGLLRSSQRRCAYVRLCERSAAIHVVTISFIFLISHIPFSIFLAWPKTNIYIWWNSDHLLCQGKDYRCWNLIVDTLKATVASSPTAMARWQRSIRTVTARAGWLELKSFSKTLPQARPRAWGFLFPYQFARIGTSGTFLIPLYRLLT